MGRKEFRGMSRDIHEDVQRPGEQEKGKFPCADCNQRKDYHYRDETVGEIVDLVDEAGDVTRSVRRCAEFESALNEPRNKERSEGYQIGEYPDPDSSSGVRCLVENSITPESVGKYIHCSYPPYDY